MIIKIIGMVVVFCTVSFAGIYYGNLDGFRIADLLEMKKALAILKSEIEFAMTPLPEALLNIGQRTKKPISGIFLALEEFIHLRRNESICDLWEESLLQHEKQSYFTKEDITQLTLFGKTLGYLDKNMQIHNISMATDYINSKITLLNQTRYKNKRLFQSLGVLGGLLLVVIFI